MQFVDFLNTRVGSSSTVNVVFVSFNIYYKFTFAAKLKYFILFFKIFGTLFLLQTFLVSITKNVLTWKSILILNICFSAPLIYWKRKSILLNYINFHFILIKFLFFDFIYILEHSTIEGRVRCYGLRLLLIGYLYVYFIIFY